MSDYQAIVIGSGPGGYPCAIRLGQLGIKTLCIEKEYWGGVCLNVGCIPSKALITAAATYETVKHAGDFGISTGGGDISIDVPTLQAWKGKVVKKLAGGVKMLLKGNGVDMEFGTARVTAPGTVEIVSESGTKTVTADNIVIATGSSPIQIPGFAYADAPIIDSTGALALDSVPENLVVIGGGVIGLELGQVWARLGSNVTVVEMMDQIIPGTDKDAVKVLNRQLKRDGVKVMLKTKALGWENTDNGAVVNVEDSKGKHALPADYVLVTVGRRPNSKGLGLEELGVKIERGFIQVDNQLKTNIPGLYAIGDVCGQPLLAHKATHDGEVAAEVIAGKNVTWDAKVVPGVVYTDPEVATVGLTELQAAEQGKTVKIGKVPFAAIGKAIANNHTDGFVKVLIDPETELILGVCIVGSHASDIVSEAVLAIEMGAEALDVGLTIHPHPTLGEAIMEATKAALGEAIHVINR